METQYPPKKVGGAYVTEFRKVYPECHHNPTFVLELQQSETLLSIYLEGPVRFSTVIIMGKSLSSSSGDYDILCKVTASEIDEAVKYSYSQCKQISYSRLVNANNYPQPYKCFSPVLIVKNKPYPMYPGDIIGSGREFDYFVMDTTTETLLEWSKLYSIFKFTFEIPADVMDSTVVNDARINFSLCVQMAICAQ